MQLVVNTHKGGEAFTRIAWLFLVVLLPVAAQGQTKTRINPKDGAVMVYIPAGEFIMGSNARDDEKPVHKVYLDGYWIYKYEVTVAQYRKFCTAKNGKMPPAPDWGWKDNHPIVNVSWNDASAYAKWAGVRLPTEAQWEKSARGGPADRQFPWGDEWPPPAQTGNFGFIEGYNDRFAETAPVGSFRLNGYGLHDMAGNASEWCADWYGQNYYKHSETRNPEGPSSGDEHVLRGGSCFDNDAYYFRVATRLADTPAEGDGGSGFRCVQVDK